MHLHGYEYGESLLEMFDAIAVMAFVKIKSWPSRYNVNCGVKRSIFFAGTRFLLLYCRRVLGAHFGPKWTNLTYLEHSEKVLSFTAKKVILLQCSLTRLIPGSIFTWSDSLLTGPRYASKKVKITFVVTVSCVSSIEFREFCK